MALKKRRQGLGLAAAAASATAIFTPAVAALGGAAALGFCFVVVSLGAGGSVADGGGDVVVEGAVVLAGDVALDEFFELVEGAVFVFGDEGDGVALGFGAAGATDAVDVVFVLKGEVEVDDVGDAGDVDAAGGDICADEDAEFSFFEFIKGALALVLGAVAVDRFGGDAGLAELLGEAAGGVLHFHKDEDGEELGAFEKVKEEGEFEVGGDLVDALAHGLCGVGAIANFYEGGLFLELTGEFFDLAGEGGGEEEGLAVVGHFFGQLAHGGEKSHVEHAVCLVHDEDFEAAHVEVALVHEVDEAAGGGDDDVGMAEGFDLGLLADSAVDGGELDAHVAGVVLDVIADLGDELAGGGDDEGADAGGLWFDAS